MRKRAMAVLTGLTLLVFSESATASPAGIPFKVDTLGAGADLTFDLGTYFNLRGGVNYGQYDLTVALDEADVEGKLRWLTFPLLLDWHPAGGGFRISAGAMINKNEISLSADPKEPLKLEGTEYSIERLEGKIWFNEFSPYFGIGYGDACGDDGRVHFACDFGVMYHGAPRVSARAISNVGPELQPLLERDLQAEVDDFKDKVSGFKYYPVISVGFSIAF